MSKYLSRLKELVEVVLPALPDDSFKLEAWEYTIDCKTVYCACGWAAQYKPFVEAGLKTEEGDLIYITKHGIWRNFQAASEFFDITLGAASYLFDPDEYPEGASTTKQEVIDRIGFYLSLA